MSNWWQELLRFFLRGLTLQQLIHMLIILIALIIITPASIKEWVDIRNPEILPDHWMYYAMLLCISYVLNMVMEFIFLASSDKYKKYLSERDEAKVIVETERLFNSLSIQEKEVLAFAVMANNKIVLKHGDPVALSLMRKGLLHRSGVTYSASGKEKFVIPDVWFHECYMRFAGKADELI